MSKAILINGASRGIGAATAEKFASNGYKLVINYNNSEAKANELKKITNMYDVEASYINNEIITIDGGV